MRVSRATAELLAADTIRSEAALSTTFFMPKSFGNLPGDTVRRQRILDLYGTFLNIASNQNYCGKALEKIVDSAATAAKTYTVFGPVWPGQRINGAEVVRECDHVLMPIGFHGPLIVVEDKNLREWLSPSAQEVWSVIGNALRIPNAVPALVCRKMHYVAFNVFKRIGLACWQVYRQFFDPQAENDLVPIRHTDGLGFSDVTTSTNPPAPLIRFFSQVLPQNSAAFRTRFESQRKLLTSFAIDKKMEGREIGIAARKELYESFVRQLPSPEHWERAEGADYGESDYQNRDYPEDF